LVYDRAGNAKTGGINWSIRVDGEKHQPMATEGGHTDFAPQTIQQDQFLSYLRKQFTDHVSWERVLCGDGFSQLYGFLLETGFAPACAAVSSDKHNASGGDRNAIISRL
jgi:glucokinase